MIKMIFRKLIQNQVCFWDCILSKALAWHRAFWSSRSVWTPSQIYGLTFELSSVEPGGSLRVLSNSGYILWFYDFIILQLMAFLWQYLKILSPFHILWSSFLKSWLPLRIPWSQSTALSQKELWAAGPAQKRYCLGKLFRRAFRETGSSYLSRLVEAFLDSSTKSQSWLKFVRSFSPHKISPYKISPHKINDGPTFGGWTLRDLLIFDFIIVSVFITVSPITKYVGFFFCLLSYSIFFLPGELQKAPLVSWQPVPLRFSRDNLNLLEIASDQSFKTANQKLSYCLTNHNLIKVEDATESSAMFSFSLLFFLFFSLKPSFSRSAINILSINIEKLFPFNLLKSQLCFEMSTCKSGKESENFPFHPCPNICGERRQAVISKSFLFYSEVICS